jgi:hypothetical protein
VKVEVEQRIALVTLVLVLLPEPDYLLQDLDVESLALGLGKDVLLLVVHRLEVLVDTLDALDERARVRTFTIITVPSNELIVRIHDRMPAILRPADYERWLGSEPDPHDLLITFPSEPMKMWPISKRVNNPRNDDEDLLAEVDLAAAS